jgi:8-oxo-dGTP diphosphatase
MIKPEDKFVRDSHCSFCGTEFTEQKLWPRKCFRCYNDSFKNSVPVAVALLSVLDQNGRVGILIQKRGIPPHPGEWALTGGFMNLNEAWEDAVARETKEEIGLVTDPKLYQMLKIISDTNGHLLIFAAYTKVVTLGDIHFIPNEEVTDIKLVYEPVELCFPTHTQMLKKYLTDLA